MKLLKLCLSVWSFLAFYCESIQIKWCKWVPGSIVQSPTWWWPIEHSTFVFRPKCPAENEKNVPVSKLRDAPLCRWAILSRIDDLRLTTSWRVSGTVREVSDLGAVCSLNRQHVFGLELFFGGVSNHVRAAACRWVNMQWRRHFTGLAFGVVFVVSYFTNKVSVEGMGNRSLKVRTALFLRRLKNKNKHYLTF